MHKRSIILLGLLIILLLLGMIGFALLYRQDVLQLT